MAHCVACKRERRFAEFSRGDFDHFIKHSRRICCTECKAKGCTPKNCALYRCTHEGCSLEAGAQKFDAKQLKNFKERGGRLHCLDCRTTDDNRIQDIERRLALPKSWKCTCKTQTKLHSEKCQLYYPGQQRWPGKNKGVTEKEWLFYEAEVAQKRNGRQQ